MANTEDIRRKYESTDTPPEHLKKKKKHGVAFVQEPQTGNVETAEATQAYSAHVKKKRQHKRFSSEETHEDSLKIIKSDKVHEEKSDLGKPDATLNYDTNQEKSIKKKKKQHLSKKNYLKKKNNMKKRKKLLAAGKMKEDSEDKRHAKDAALEYLQLWEDDRTAWKFMKVRQVWLLQHMYDKEQVDEAKFEILLKYLEPMKGKGRETTVKEAVKIVESAETSDETKADRARRIIQLYPD